MRDPFGQLLLPLLAGLFMAFFGWNWMRIVGRGRPFTPFKKVLLTCASLFITGMSFAMMWDTELADILGIPGQELWVALSISWGGLLAYLGWRWIEKQPRAEAQSSAQSSVDQLGEGVSTVGLLVCLIGADIEWEFVFKSEGRLWVALLWTAGAGVIIVLAKAYRRAVVRTVLRAVLALGILGALARPSIFALTVVAAIVAVLLLVEKTWKIRSGPVGSESLEAEEPSPPHRDPS